MLSTLLLLNPRVPTCSVPSSFYIDQPQLSYDVPLAFHTGYPQRSHDVPFRGLWTPPAARGNASSPLDIFHQRTRTHGILYCAHQLRDSTINVVMPAQTRGAYGASKYRVKTFVTALRHRWYPVSNHCQIKLTEYLPLDSVAHADRKIL